MDKKINQAIDVLAPLALGGLLVVLRIANVKWDKEKTPTACITAQNDNFNIYINPDFEKKYASTPEKLAGVLLHELMHKALGITRYPPTQLWNLAADAYINAFIHKIHPRFTGAMEEFYSPDQIPYALLRPGGRVNHFELREVYQKLYQELRHASIPEIAEALMRAFPPQKKQKKAVSDAVLIGSHPDQGGIDRRSSNTVREGMREAGKRAGMGSSSFWLQVLGLKTGSSELQRALSKAAVQNARGRIVDSLINRISPDKSVIPQFCMGRAESVYYSLGLYPLFHTVPREENEKKAALVYVDVSGSMFPYYEFIYGVLQKLEGMLFTKCYMFSNKTEELTKEDLKEGNIRSTFGTDFNCIISHLMENPVEKALIFTDGYANISASNLQKLKESKIQLIGGIITKNKSSDLYKMCREVIYIPPEARRS